MYNYISNVASYLNPFAYGSKSAQSVRGNCYEITRDVCYLLANGDVNKISTLAKDVSTVGKLTINYSQSELKEYQNITKDDVENRVITKIFDSSTKDVSEAKSAIKAFLNLEKEALKVSEQFKKNFNNCQTLEQKAFLVEQFETILTTADKQREHLQLLCNEKKAEVIKEFIAKGDLNSLRSILKSKADFNLRDSLNNTPLINAIKNNQKEIVEFLLEQGDEVDRRGQNGSTPLMFACQNANDSIAELLIKQGADVNAKNDKGLNPLIFACLKDSFSLAKLLIDNKANPQIWCGSRPVHYAMMRDCEELKNLLMPYEINSSFSTFFLLEKMICHRFGISHTYELNDKEKIKFEGTELGINVKELNSSLDEFVSLHPELQAAKEIFSQSMENRKNLKHAFSDGNSSDIISFPTGWKGHSTGIVVSKSQNLLIKTNRGNENENKPGIRIYKIGKPEKLAEVLQKSINNEYEGDSTIFNITLNNELELSEVTSEYMPHKDQHAGNCGWASSKLNLRAIIYLTLRSALGHEEAAKRSRELYKEWSQFDRSRSLNQFLTSLEEISKIQGEGNPTKQDLQKEGIVPEQILTKVIFKCVRDRQIESLKLLLENRPELQKTINEKGMTPLILAYILNQKEVFKILSDNDQQSKELGIYLAEIKGIYPEASQQKILKKAIFKCIDEGKQGILKILVENAPYLLKEKTSVDKNDIPIDTQGPLLYAYFNNKEAFEVLKNAGNGLDELGLFLEEISKHPKAALIKKYLKRSDALFGDFNKFRDKAKLFLEILNENESSIARQAIESYFKNWFQKLDEGTKEKFINEIKSLDEIFNSNQLEKALRILS